MRVRANATFAGDGYSIEAGEVLDVDENAWSEFIENGFLSPLVDVEDSFTADMAVDDVVISYKSES